MLVTLLKNHKLVYAPFLTDRFNNNPKFYDNDGLCYNYVILKMGQVCIESKYFHPFY